MKEIKKSGDAVITKVWEVKADYEFNQVLACPVFRDKKPSIVTAGQDGIVRVHELKQNEATGQFDGIVKTPVMLETKGGPVQCLHAQNVTKFNSVDIVSADARGLLVIFSNNQILNRRVVVENCISTMCFDSDAAGNLAIVTGARDGTLVAVTAYSILWKVNLNDVAGHQITTGHDLLGISCLQRYCISQHGLEVNYIAVGDTCGNLHLFQEGYLVKTINLASTVVGMCTGNFTGQDCVPNDGFVSVVASPSKHGQSVQRSSLQRGRELAVALKDGSVIVMKGLKQTPYANLKFQLGQILTIPSSSLATTDALVCTGQFHYVYVIHNGIVLSQYQTRDWVTHATLLTLPEKETPPVAAVDLIVACADSSIQHLSINLHTP